jgi:DNA-binding transcriptional regulator GbsR (MarR family)
MHRDVAKFIERMGLLWEEEGLPRIAGRIYALVLLSPDPCSLDFLAETLRVSKPSVSNDARLLHKLGLIERISFSGDRKDYYQLTRDSIERSLETRVLRLRSFQSTIASAASLPIRNEEVLRRIEAHELAHQAVIHALESVITRLRTRAPSLAENSRT